MKVTLTCSHCSKQIELEQSQFDRRMRASATKKLYCSKLCADTVRRRKQ